MKINLILFVITGFIYGPAFGQTTLIDALNKNIIEVQTTSPDSCFSDLNTLNTILTGNKIIGLGEATHGTHEFFTYKHRLIKYLVTEQNYRVFIIEGSFGGSHAMYDYVVHGKGTINEALYGVSYGVWFTKEFVALVEWMKEYNSDKALVDKIKFYGCDLNYSVNAAKKVEAYLTKEDRLSTTLKKGFDWVINENFRRKITKEDERQKNQFLAELNGIFKNLEDKNDRELLFIKHCIREIEQSLELDFANDKTSITLRDKYMSENIDWIYRFENDQKAIFWAHNEHIKNDKAKSDQKPVGFYLKEKFKDQYYAFGFGFYKGRVTGYNRAEKKYDSFEVPQMDSNKLTDAVFSQCVYPDFILDIKTANENTTVSKFLNTTLQQRTIGAGFYPDGEKRYHYRMAKLIDKYDGLIFFRTTHPATRLSK